MNRHRGLPHAAPHHRADRFMAQGHLPRGYIDGFIVSNDGTDATNDLAIAPGSARSTVNIVDGGASTHSHDQIDIDIPTTIIKQVDVEWAPDNYDHEGFSGGGRSGGRSQSSLADGTWHIFVIGKRSEKPDVMLHDSAEQSSVLAALPGGYTAYRRIGSIIRASGALLLRTQIGDFFRYKVPLSWTITSTTSRQNQVVNGVPLGLSLMVQTSWIVSLLDAYVILTCPDDTDTAPSASLAQIRGVSATTSGAGLLWTNTAAEIGHRASTGSTVNTDFRTWGYWDTRGRDA